MELISKQAVINKILSEPPEFHSPSWYAIQIKALDSINIDEKIDQAYEDGYETGYLQAEFDYKQEIEELREAGKKMHSPGSTQNDSSRRAKWISQTVYYSTIGSLWVKWQCSCCGYIRNKGWEHTKDGKMPNAIFCEKCGADMREIIK